MIFSFLPLTTENNLIEKHITERIEHSNAIIFIGIFGIFPFLLLNIFTPPRKSIETLQVV